MTITVLNGHISPDTAYTIENYPYSFRLKCQKRVWIDVSATFGARVMSQTTNPKRGGGWNTVKAGTYSRFGGALYLDEQGHVQFTGLHEYMSDAQTVDWAATYLDGVPASIRKLTDQWLKAKAIHALIMAERDAREQATLEQAA